MRLTLITGMHRSGTSAVAGVAHLVGADLGDPDGLLPPARDNPRGFFELTAFKEANDLALATLGGTWQRLPVFTEGWERLPSVATARSEAQAVLESLEDRGAPIILKDPRASVTFPLWASLTSVAQTITCIRHPAEVAGSLARRNGMSADVAADLWIRYTCAAIHHCPNTLVVDYQDLLAAPARIAAEVAAHLGLPEPDDATIARVQEFVAADLRHQSTDLAPPGRLTDAVWLYERILDGAGDVTPIARLMDWRSEGATAGIDEREAMSRKLARATKRGDELQARLDALRARTADDLEASRRQREELRGRLLESTDEIEYLRARLRRREYDLRTTASHESARRAESDAATRKGAELRDQVAALQAEVASLRDAERRARRDRNHARNDLERLRSRRSVRTVLKAASLARPVFRAVRSRKQEVMRGEPASADTAIASSTDDSVAPTEEAPVAGLGHAISDAATDARVTIVIPVHDAPDALRRCVESVRRNTTTAADLVVVDDASRLPATHAILEELEAHPRVTVLRNDDNRGFTHSVNRGLSACSTDVIVLNSDTEVPPRWVERLRIAAYSDERVGSATAISDDAGAFAVPTPGAHNPVPPHLSSDAAARAVAAAATWSLPPTPTAHGFCMYLRREMLDDVGLLDEAAFPRGYGEENDLSMRAGSRGWAHVVADAVFVRHTRGSSFGDEREGLITAGRRVVDERWPQYTDAVRSFVKGEPMRAVRARVERLWGTADERTGRPRVLYVVHEGRGGTPNTSLDLASAIEDRWQSFVLTSDTRTLRLHEVVDGSLRRLREWGLDQPIRFGEESRPDVAAVVTEVLVGYAIDLVHSRHLVKNTFDVLSTARRLGIPTVISFHDFFMSCPTVHLLDENEQFCGGVCTPGDGPCHIPMKWIAEDAPPLKHDGVHAWRQTVRPHLLAADALVTTSSSAVEVYRRSYPELDQDAITVIEHGRDIAWSPIGATPPPPGGRIRMLVPGNLDVHKGGRYLERMLAADTGGRLELHFAGKVPTAFQHLGVDHGPYERDQFRDLVAQVRPHVVGVLSIWAETYNHTLTEAWMAGVPVMATDIGAPGERIRAHGGGFLVPVDDPRRALKELFRVLDDDEAYADLTGPRSGAVRDAAAMAADYDRLYLGALAGRRVFEQPEPYLDVGLIALGTDTRAPGSVHVRTQGPLAHPSVRAGAHARRTSPSDLGQTGDPDVLVVQRTAVEPDELPKVEAWLDAGRPLVYDVDDMLFDDRRLPELDEGWSRHVETVRALMRRATIVTVSTPLLAEAAAEVAREVVVVPNALNERLWFRPGATAELPPDLEADPPGTLRLLYVGTTTHGDDLSLLEPAMDEVAVRLDRPVRLTVVGGEAPRTDRHWYRQVPIPHRDYPRFVPWVRSLARHHDVALAPLVDTPFTRMKSDLKWLEYSAMGLPGVFADLPPYHSVTPGETGMLAPPDDVDAWVAGICELADPERRQRVVAAARAHVLAQRTLDRSGHRWLEVLRAAQRARELQP